MEREKVERGMVGCGGEGGSRIECGRIGWGDMGWYRKGWDKG